MKKIFITATDTDAGKTYVSQLLTCALVKQGKKIAVFKPISAGCQWQGELLLNEDALLLQKQANCQQSIQHINPVAFEEAIAPHIAAQQADKKIDIAQLVEHYNVCYDQPTPDLLLTEGAGGWRLPLGNGKFLSEFVQVTQQQVILVVNMKLGCLNHAILTYQAIIEDGLECIGWVANCIDHMDYLAENIAELTHYFPMLCMGKLGNEADIEKAAQQINLTALL
jgi:dethiobiotin synthetase